MVPRLTSGVLGHRHQLAEGEGAGMDSEDGGTLPGEALNLFAKTSAVILSSASSPLSLRIVSAALDLLSSFVSIPR